MNATLLVKTAVRAGLAIGTVGKGAKPHAFRNADEATLAGVTLCKRTGRVDMSGDIEAELCGPCSVELIALLAQVFEEAAEETPATTEEPVEDDTEAAEDNAQGGDEETVLTPGPESIETTQDREEKSRQEAGPTRALVTTTDYKTVEGMEEILNAGAAVIADAFKTTISIGLKVANTMLQLRRFILVDGLPSLDGKSNQYQAAVAALFDLATKQVAGVHEVDVKEVRNQIKRAAQNQMSAVLVPYVRALDDADEEERARYAPLLEAAEESQRVAVEAARSYYDEALKDGNEEHIALAAETLELAERPISLTDLVHDHYDIPRQTRQGCPRPTPPAAGSWPRPARRPGTPPPRRRRRRSRLRHRPRLPRRPSSRPPSSMTSPRFSPPCRLPRSACWRAMSGTP